MRALIIRPHTDEQGRDVSPPQGKSKRRSESPRKSTETARIRFIYEILLTGDIMFLTILQSGYPFK